MKFSEEWALEKTSKYNKSITIFGAQGTALDEMVFMLAGATNGDNFAAFCEYLAPRFTHEGTKVIVDGHSAHKNLIAKLTLQENDAELVVTPSHTSEFNPVEHVWASLKVDVRKVVTSYWGRATVDDLQLETARFLELLKGRNDSYNDRNMSYIGKQIALSDDLRQEDQDWTPPVEVVDPKTVKKRPFRHRSRVRKTPRKPMLMLSTLNDPKERSGVYGFI